VTGLLLDTHVWLWYLSGSRKLPKSLRSEIDRSADRCWLSPISIWEAGLLHEKSRIRIKTDLASLVRDSRSHLPWREAGVNSEVAIMSLRVDLPHRDPADRLIAATALVYELELATLDARLVAANWLPTLSG
jgi:PIN domain nuclease of toxin-antitoxin system